MDNELRYAILIDADNVSDRYIKIILDEVANTGIITYKRIYGDWTSSRMVSWKKILLENSIIPIQQYSYTVGKNSTDSALIIDAMDILYSDTVDGFCLVSSDSDFTRLAARLRESGMEVIGMGEAKTPKPFISACNQFKYLDRLYLAQQKAEKEERERREKEAKARRAKEQAEKAQHKKSQSRKKAAQQKHVEPNHETDHGADHAAEHGAAGNAAMESAALDSKGKGRRGAVSLVPEILPGKIQPAEKQGEANQPAEIIPAELSAEIPAANAVSDHQPIENPASENATEDMTAEPHTGEGAEENTSAENLSGEFGDDIDKAEAEVWDVTPVRSTVDAILNQFSDDDGWLSTGKLGDRLSKRMPEFDVRNYGFSKLTSFIRSLGDYEIRRMSIDGGPRQIYLRMKERDTEEEAGVEEL